jgi:quinol monooxygenase YgiN
MGEPIVYLSTWKIKDGRFEDYRQFYARMVDAIRTRDRGVLAFYAFGNEDGTEITNVHVFPDRTTLERHMAVLAEQMGLLPADLTAVTSLMDPVDVQVYGMPSATATAMDQGLIDAGVPFTGKRTYIGGFSLADQRADAPA